MRTRQGTRGWLAAFAMVGGLAGSGVAQAIVVPRGAGVSGDLAQREANSSFHLPARYAPSRVLVVYRGADLGVGANGFRIGSIAFRRDGLRTTSYSAHKWKLTVNMSAVGVTLPSGVLGKSFDGTHGNDRIKVVDAKLVDWPAEPKPAKPPAQFNVQVKLDRPFVLPRAQNLCVDLLSEAPSNQRETFYWYADAERFDRTSFMGKARFLGRGCPFAFQTRATIPPLDGESRIMTYSYTRHSGSGGAWAFLLVGTSNTRWGSTPLPITLPGPNGCRLYTDPAFLQAGRTQPNEPRGLVRFWSGPLPRLSALVGLVFYEQVLVEDPAGPLGVRSSNYLEMNLGRLSDPLPARLIYHSGPNLSNVPTGMVDVGLALRLGQ